MTNEIFLNQTITNGLYYLRTIHEYCTNIFLAFLEKNHYYKNKAQEFANTCSELEDTLIKYANNNIYKSALDGDILFTEYTLPCEVLTEKLFDVQSSLQITKEELQLTPGIPQNVSDETVDILNEANKKALQLTQDFSTYLRDIFSKENKNEIFSYSYPGLITYMNDETDLYNSFLERIIKKQMIDPTYVTNYEFVFTSSMRDVAKFIRSFVNSSSEDIFIKAQSYVVEFDYLMSDYRQTSLSPDNQKELTEKALSSVKRFANFIKECIEKLLNAKLYFSIEPIFLDNMLTEANYFIYILNLNKDTENIY